MREEAQDAQPWTGLGLQEQSFITAPKASVQLQVLRIS